MKQEEKVEYEKSRIGVTFGDDFENPPAFGRFELYFNEAKSIEQLEKLRVLHQDKLDLEWSVVISLNCLEGKKVQMQNELNQLKETKPFLPYVIKSYLGTDDKIHISIKLSPDDEAEFTGMLQVFIDGVFMKGLQNVTGPQMNKIEGSIEFNYNFQNIDAQMEKGERVVSSLLKNLKAEVNINLHTALAEKLKTVIQTIDPNYNESPPMLFISYFRNLDIDLQFNSTDDLPETMKNQMIFGKKVQKLSEEDRRFPSNKLPNLHVMKDFAGDFAEFSVTIPGIAALRLEAKMPFIADFFFKYGRALAGMIGYNI